MKPNPQKKALREAWRFAIDKARVESRGANRGAIEGWRARNNRKPSRFVAIN